MNSVTFFFADASAIYREIHDERPKEKLFKEYVNDAD